MKSKITEILKLLKGCKDKFEKTEEKISKFKDKTMEIFEFEEHKGKKD